jgi:hypothetical protein
MSQKAEAGQRALLRRIIDSLFLRHPAEIGESYFEHLLFTFTAGGHLLVTATVLMFHGLLPKFCQTTASRRLARINRIIQKRREAFEGQGK